MRSSAVDRGTYLEILFGTLLLLGAIVMMPALKSRLNPESADSSPLPTSVESAPVAPEVVEPSPPAPEVVDTNPAPPVPLAPSAPSIPPAERTNLLVMYQPSGASLRTASQDALTFKGVPASETMAETDEQRVERLCRIFSRAGKRHNLPPKLLAAIASRESRGGAVLDRGGRGDHGNAFGVMQVDQRFHAVRGSDPLGEEHIDQAASILADFLLGIEWKHPDWPRERQLQGAVAAYNFGLKNVQTMERLDLGTTGNDYSNDVWARALYYPGCTDV